MKTQLEGYNTEAEAMNACNAMGYNPEIVIEADSGKWIFDVMQIDGIADKIEAAEDEPEEDTSEIEEYIRRHSEIEGPCKRVWAIADSMPGAQRKDVLAACDLEGIAFYTARTQYQSWKHASEVIETEVEPEAEVEPEVEETEEVAGTEEVTE